MKIAVYMNSLSQNYQRMFYRGVQKRAKELGVNTVCIQNDLTFLSKHIPADAAIFLTPSLSGIKDFIFEKSFSNQFNGIPLLCAGNAVPGISSIIVQSEEAMQDLMTHLLDVHGYTNLLYVGGTESHPDNILREGIFKKTIQKRKHAGVNIQYECIHTSFTEYTSMIALEEWINRNPGNIPQVIVCANDNIAVGVRRIVQIQENPQWTKTAITGFDDIDCSLLGYPDLTTVHQPVNELGEISLETAYRLVQREKIVFPKKIDSKLIIRQSCGCKVERNFTYNISEEKEKGIAERTEQYVTQLGRHLNRTDSFQSTCRHLDSFAAYSGLQYFSILLFSESGQMKKEMANLVYEYNLGTSDFYDLQKSVSLKDFFNSRSQFFFENDEGSVICSLTSGKKILGFMIYRTQQKIHSQMYNCSLFLSAAIERLNSLNALEKEVQKRTKKLLIANEKLKVESERRIKVEAQVLKVGELERQRFSMDLHDDICQRLAGISMICKGLSKDNPPIEELSLLIDETLHRTRLYAHNSFPTDLKSEGLKRNLESLCEAVQKESLNALKVLFEWKVPKRCGIDKDPIRQINIFRIVQEALHNTMKHSKADTVLVSVSGEIQKSGQKVKVIISDNGIGISKKKSDRNGMGLTSMKYRADQIGAKFTIKKGGVPALFKNAPSGGCTLELVIPV